MFDGVISNGPEWHSEPTQQRSACLLWRFTASLAGFGLILAVTVTAIAALDRAGMHPTVCDEDCFKSD